jgi:carbamoyl-phosphate synthase large subunit
MDVLKIMNGKRVFVSGGAGVIGLEMIPKLLARGATVMVGDLKSRPTSFPREVIYRQGDLNEMHEREMRQFAPEIFIHLAATFERSAETYGFWEENFWHNVRLSHHMMSLVKDQSTLERVVFASSYLIYDPTLYQFSSPSDAAVSLREGDPVQPRNLTGMAKFSHEIELRFIDQFRASHFSTVCTRIFRGYGRNSRDVISRWIRSLLNGETITVYRGEGLFDYIYAVDTAEGLIRLAEKVAVTGIINLGTGQSRRVNDVVNILREYFPCMKSVDAESDIPFEASQAEMSRFGELVGWIPEYDLEKAIAGQ